MRILVDAMGGDNAPREIVAGALAAAEEYGIEITLVGRGEDILSSIRELGGSDLPKAVTIAHASEVVAMTDSPSNTLREKPDSSLAVGLRMLAAGEGDAIVSAGSTGALLSGAIFTVKRMKGVKRAALSPVVPSAKGGSLLIDCGANLECKPEYLLQFGIMGSLYASRVLHRENPRVGLLNIGAEENKGTDLQKQAYQLLTRVSSEGLINFAGNIEGRDAMLGAADVIVADGYSGNIFLKTMEGVGMYFADMLKSMFYKSTKTKLAAMMVKDGLREFKKTLDYAETGGSPLLGLSMPVIKAHGSSNAKALKNAIRQARDFAGSGIIPMIADSISAMGSQETEE